MPKQLVDLITYGKNGGSVPDCTGRLLGVVDDKLFSAIKRDKKAAGKVVTSETVSLKNVVDALEAIDMKKMGARIAIALASKADNKGKLFISPRIDTVNSYTTDKSVSLNVSTDLWFRIEQQEG